MPSASLVQQGLHALVLGACGAFIFYWLDLPLPWILGSMTACAIFSLSGARLAMPGLWRSSSLAMLGVLLGGGFTAETLHAVPNWWLTIVLMLVLSVIYLLFSNSVLKRWSGMSNLTRMFSAVPGGLAILSALSELYDADTRRIALNHSARLVSLLVLVPLVLSFAGEQHLSSSSRPVNAAHDFSWSHLIDYSLLLISAASGPFLVRYIRFPLGILLFPFLFSALFHITGWVNLQLPFVVAALAQVVLGASVGIRFVGYSWRDILLDGWLSIVIGVMLAILAALAAWLFSAWLALDFATLLLVFMPGGAAEMGVMAIALDIDPAMVATHHILRVFAVVGGVSVVVSWFLPQKKSQ